MSFIYRKSMFAKFLGMALVLLALGLGSSGCTLGECAGGERELCIAGAGCVCGDICATDDNCTEYGADNEMQECFAYEFTPMHGVCVDKTFIDTHDPKTAEFPDGQRRLPFPG